MKSYRVRERLHENLLDHLLLARGVPQEQFAEFLEPDFERDSHNPFLLPDMEVAVERLLSAQKAGEKVAVWSDYDADGIPGGAMLVHFLRAMGLAVVHYIPHRHKEGYGLNHEGIDELAAQKVGLMITVDLGTTDHEAVAYAKTKGIDTIITDHHLVSDVLPPALAVINPKRPDSRYLFDGLCGAGVAWKLVQAILSKNRPDGFAEGQEKWYLDLVGLATLSDMVPLVGENRMLAHFGLRVMRSPQLARHRPGLASLMSLLRLAPNSLTEDDVGFMLSPRINAASRMDSPHIAAALLAATDLARGRELTEALEALNKERKSLVAMTSKEARRRLAASAESPVVVLGNPAWRPGILGLVAGSLSEATGKPVCLWGMEGGDTIRGSCRGGGVNVMELLAATGDVFEDFGGHAASGGFSVSRERVHELPGRLAAAYDSLVSRASAAREVTLDRELDLAEVPHAHASLKRLAPFGVGFEKPLFIFHNVTIARSRAFGKERNHLELSLARLAVPAVNGVAFFSTPGSFSKRGEVGVRCDVVGHVELDWRGQPRVRVVDLI